MHYSGVVCRRTAKFENYMALAICSSRSPLPLQEPQRSPSQAQHDTRSCREWGYHHRCSERLKCSKHASSRTPIYRSLQTSRGSCCMLELVCVEEGELPEVKHRPSPTPPGPIPIAPSIPAPTAGKTSTAPTAIRARPNTARHKVILEQQFRIIRFQILTL